MEKKGLWETKSGQRRRRHTQGITEVLSTRLTEADILAMQLDAIDWPSGKQCSGKGTVYGALYAVIFDVFFKLQKCSSSFF